LLLRFFLDYMLERESLHELFHEVAGNYGGWSDSVDEGNAMIMRDKIYSDMDTSVRGGFNAYLGRAREYLNGYIHSSLIRGSVKIKMTMDVFLGLPPKGDKVGVELPILAFFGRYTTHNRSDYRCRDISTRAC